MPCVLALVLTGCVSSQPKDAEPENKLTRANYEILSDGLTRTQIIEIMGEPRECASGSEVSETFPEGFTLETCTWGTEMKDGSGTYVTVYLENGKLYKKRMSGLK